MVLQCSNCGAPLDTQRVSGNIRCRYCRATSAVQSLQTQHHVTPAWYRPPPIWIPPPQYNLPQTPLRLSRVDSLGLFAFLAVSFLASAIGVLLPSRSSRPTTSTTYHDVDRPDDDDWTPPKPPAGAAAEEWPDGTFNCSSGTHTFRFVGGMPAQGPMIHAGGSCVVTLDHATLWGTGIVAEGNAKIVIRHSTITTTGTLVTARGNAQVELSNTKVTFALGVSWLDLHDNAVVTLQDSPGDVPCRANVADLATVTVKPPVPCAVGKGSRTQVTGLTSPQVRKWNAKRQ